MSTKHAQWIVCTDKYIDTALMATSKNWVPWLKLEVGWTTVPHRSIPRCKPERKHKEREIGTRNSWIKPSFRPWNAASQSYCCNATIVRIAMALCSDHLPHSSKWEYRGKCKTQHVGHFVAIADTVDLIRFGRCLLQCGKYLPNKNLFWAAKKTFKHKSFPVFANHSTKTRFCW